MTRKPWPGRKVIENEHSIDVGRSVTHLQRECPYRRAGYMEEEVEDPEEEGGEEEEMDVEEIQCRSSACSQTPTCLIVEVGHSVRVRQRRAELLSPLLARAAAGVLLKGRAVVDQHPRCLVVPAQVEIESSQSVKAIHQIVTMDAFNTCVEHVH